MKKTAFFLSFMLFGIFIWATPVSYPEACQVARNWTAELGNNFKDQVDILIGEAIIREGVVVAYVFHLSPRGYVIISAEDYLPPVKLYSLKNNFGREGKALEEKIFIQYREIMNRVKRGQIDPAKYFNEGNKTTFNRLRNRLSRARSDTTAVEEVPPLLKTTWYQKEPYNLKCPVVEGERCVTGCVATGLAQVMKYWAYPPKGQGSWSYQTATHQINLSTSFEHPYYWDRMLDHYPEPDSGTPAQREAVSRLMFDVGVSVNMDYDPGGSGAGSTTAVITFPVFFKYAREVLAVKRLGHNDQEWFKLAKNQLDQGIVIPYSIFREGAGHLVVIDGYRISGNAATFHLNMGWAGTWDGYYSLNNIVVRDNKHYAILDWQGYVLNLIPPDSGVEPPAMEVGARAYENRSLFFREYYCEIVWKGLPVEAEGIEKYSIVKFNMDTMENEDFAEIAHTGQKELYRLSFRMDEFKPDVYSVWVYDQSDGWILLMRANLVRK